MREEGQIASIHQRVSALIDKMEAGNKSAFARAINLSTGALADLIGGRHNKPSFDVLTKILAAYPLVNPAWLIAGEEEGPMMRPTEEPAATEQLQVSAVEEPRAAYGTGVRVLTVQVDTKNNENIELVSSRAAAGYIAGGFLEPEFIGQLPSFNLPDPAFRNATFRAFQVSGDSMQSTLYEGDWIICRYVEHWDRDIRDGYVHVVVTEDSLLVKRVLNRLNERGELTLLSDNTAIPTQFLDAQLVREVWVGVGRLSRKLINPRFDVNQELMRTRADVDELLAFMQEIKGQSPKPNKPK